MVGRIVEESRFVQIRAHRESVNSPGVDFGHHLEAVEAEPDVRAFADVNQPARAILHLLPARPNFDPVTTSGGAGFQKTCLKIEFLFVDRPWTAATVGVKSTLQLQKRANVFAEVKVQREHVPLVQVSVVKGLLS